MDLNEEIEVALPDDEIEVVPEETLFDDPEDEGRPIASADEPTEDPTDEEIEALSSKRERVRIRKVIADKHAERRRADLAEKERNEALQAAEMYKRIAEQKREEALKLTAVTARASRAALAEQTQTLTARLRAAIDAGDSEEQVKVSQQLTQVQAQLTQIPTDEVIERDVKDSLAKPVGPAIPAPAPNLHPRVAEWVRANDSWFNKDPDMTQAAISFANILESRERIGPDSDEYYARIEAVLASAFPGKFRATSKQQEKPVSSKAPAEGKKSAPVGGPITRLPNGKTQVRLTPAEIATAENLGISPADYAREKMRMSRETGY